MIIADEMQEAMHGEVGDMMEEQFALRPRLSLDSFEGQDNVAEVAQATS